MSAVQPESIHSATDKAAHALHNAVDKMAEKGAWAEAQIRKSGQQASESSHEIADEMKQYVQSHPLASLGMAVAAGFILASLLKR